jgi:DinB superfamily
MTAIERPFDKVRRKLVAARIEFMGQLAKFSKEELLQHPTSEGWSPLQIAHHLYITDGLALQEMQRVVDEDNPRIINLGLEAPHQTTDSEPPVSLDAVLGGLAARREEIFEYLSQLPEDAWERPFSSEEWGERKFYQMVNVLPVHDQIHTQQLATLKEKLSSKK